MTHCSDLAFAVFTLKRVWPITTTTVARSSPIYIIYWPMRKSNFARFARVFLTFVHEIKRPVVFFFQIPNRWFQFNSRILRTHFASVKTLVVYSLVVYGIPFTKLLFWPLLSLKTKIKHSLKEAVGEPYKSVFFGWLLGAHRFNAFNPIFFFVFVLFCRVLSSFFWHQGLLFNNCLVTELARAVLGNIGPRSWQYGPRHYEGIKGE